MNRHLTEQELIEYEFKLASDVLIGEISGHLEDCTQCREDLEKLRSKFSALDLLREEIQASEDLISRVVEQAKQPVRTRIVPFGKPVWLGAAAAVLLVGSILFFTNQGKDKVEGPGIPKEPESVETVGTVDLEKSVNIDRSRDLDEDFAVARRPSLDVARLQNEGEERLSKVTEEKYTGGQISEQPPFAPASAIELVVLPRRDKVRLTIYNSADLTLVRERRNLTLKRGWNWLQFMWANTLIDPTSLSLEPLVHADKIDIQQLVFPARLRELGRWLIRSEVSGQVPFEITYFTSGLNWRAFYMGTMAEDEKTMRLQGYVRVGNNSGEDYENAQTRLIVGKVHILDQIAELAKRQYPYGRPIIGIYRDDSVSSYGRSWQWDKKSGLDGLVITNGESTDLYLSPPRPKEIKKEGLSEYFLYTIEGTETIADKWGKRLLSFEAEDIKIKSLYKYDEERWGTQTIRFIAFTNDEEHNLGQTPIPNGNVKIYSQADSEGYLSYIGGTDIKYIPVNEEVELNLGPARLVKVEPTLMDFKTENYVYDRKGNISGWDEIRTWKIEITNTRELPIEIEITRGFDTAYWTLKTGVRYELPLPPMPEARSENAPKTDSPERIDNRLYFEKHDATHARFTLYIEPRGKRTFDYTVTTYHGVREESLTKAKK